MSSIPFGTVEMIRKEAQEDRCEYDLLKEFLRCLGIPGIGRILSDAEHCVETSAGLSLSTAVTACCGEELPFVVKTSLRSETLTRLLLPSFAESPLFKDVLSKVYEAKQEGEERVVVLHRVKHLGVYVTTGYTSLATPTPRIMLPSIGTAEHLYIMPLKAWADEYRKTH